MVAITYSKLFGE